MPLLRAYVFFSGANLAEAEKELCSYLSLQEFFTRSLKAGSRTIASGKELIVSPVDGTLSIIGEVQDGMMIQAKGRSYSLSNLLKQSDLVKYFEGGKYLVFYLAPGDYHRIHSPCNAEVHSCIFVHGGLLPVNPQATRLYKNLFVYNERLITFLECRGNLSAMVQIGALNVGSIQTLYNINHPNRSFFEKGEEMARFEMGSTVVLLFEKERFAFLDTLRAPSKICLGNAIGQWT